MAEYRLRLIQIESRTDGNIRHDIMVLTVDEQPTGLHKDVLIPYTAIQAVLALPAAQRANAYKDAIWNNRNNQDPMADTSQWSFELLAAAVGSMTQAIAATNWLASVGITLPFNFTLDSG